MSAGFSGTAAVLLCVALALWILNMLGADTRIF
jgi:hypothetical protein